MPSDVSTIEQLIYRYCHLIDREGPETMREIFHRNAILHPEYEGDERHEGIEAIVGWYQRYNQSVKEDGRWWILERTIIVHRTYST